ncbi:MAG: hypothetical protein OQL08_13375, partial [Gammaproteobacteria bacterium]|nr:hypothetical protein [Gammaproteobacteria bacterium]
TSQIVKERSQLLSWEAGILPAFETLSTTIADMLPVISSREPLHHAPNSSTKFAAKTASPCALRQAVPPKKCALYAPPLAAQEKLRQIMEYFGNSCKNSRLKMNLVTLG